MAKKNLIMDGLSTKSDDNGFDDNGLQHAFMLASWQEIPSSECISEKDTEGSELSQCVAISTGRDEVKSTEIGGGDRKPYRAAPSVDGTGAISLGVHPEIVGVIGDEENQQLLIPKDHKDAKKGTDQKDDSDIPVGHTARTEETENIDGRSAERFRKVKAKKEKSGLHPEIVGVIRDEENQQLLIPKEHKDAEKGSDQKDELDLPVGHTARKEEVESADGRNTKRSRKVKAKKEKLGLHQEIAGVIRNEENQQLLIPKDAREGIDQKHDSDLPVGDTTKKEEAGNFDGKMTKNPRKEEAKRTKFRSGRSAKDGGSFKRITDLGILSFLVSFWATFCGKISWHFSVSLTAGILFLMPSVGVDSALTAVPTNTLVVVGTTVRINCSTDLNQPVYWARTPAQSDEQQWLYYGNDGFHSSNADGRFSIDKDETTGRYDVIIENIQPKDAGRYVCIDDSGLGVRASAELVISDPINCKSHIPSDGIMGYNVFGLPQDFIHVSCSLSYAGNLSPTLEWSWTGSDVQSVERDVYAATSFVSSTLKLSPTKELNNSKFECRPNIVGATQHTIESGLLWQSETVNVKYAEFAPEEIDACPGVEWNLVCNPQCSYSFEERKDHECRCLYTYYDKRTQQNHQTTSYAVKCANSNVNLPVVLIIVAVVIATLIVTVITSTFVCCLTKKKKKMRPDSAEPCIGQKSGEDMPEAI